MTFEYNQQSIEKAITYKKRKRKIKYETSKRSLKRFAKEFLKRFSRGFLLLSFSIVFLIIIIIVSFRTYNMNFYEGLFTHEGKNERFIYADYYEVHGSFITFYRYWWRLGRKEIMTGRIGHIKREKTPKYEHRSSGGSLLDRLDFGDKG